MAQTTSPPGHNLLALLSFNHKGHVLQTCALPADIKLEHAQEYAALTLASSSITEGFLTDHATRAKPTPVVHLPPNASAATVANTLVCLHPTVVSLDEHAVLLALPPLTPAASWLCLFINPLVLHDSRVLQAILSVTFIAAQHLMGVHTGSDPLQPCFSLWKSMRKLLRTGNWWYDEKRALHAKNALIELAEIHVHAAGVPRDQCSVFADAPLVHTCILEFCVGVRKDAAVASVQVCVVSPDRAVCCRDGMSEAQACSVVWYFDKFVNAGVRFFGTQFVEVVEGHPVVRLWYQWRRWVLCALVVYRDGGRASLARDYGYRSAMQVLRAFEAHAKLRAKR